jgi:hypothetical protein
VEVGISQWKDEALAGEMEFSVRCSLETTAFWQAFWAVIIMFANVSIAVLSGQLKIR